MSWIQTRRGISFELLKPSPVDVDIEDLAWSLGRICRFSGHTSKFYSVAEHSILVAQYALKLRHPSPMERGVIFMAGLLHDAHEAYAGDLTSPMKVALSCRIDGFKEAYKELVESIDEAIVTALVPPWKDRKQELRRDVLDHMQGSVIEGADLALLNTERAQLLGPPPKPWVKLPPPAYVHIEGWSPEEASERWLAHWATAQLALAEGPW